MAEHSSLAELVEFDDPLVAQQLFGPNNANLELLARASGARIASRGLKVLIETADPRKRQCLCSVFLQLYELFRSGVQVTQEDVLRSYDMVLNDPGVALSEVYREAVFIHTPPFEGSCGSIDPGGSTNVTKNGAWTKGFFSSTSLAW